MSTTTTAQKGTAIPQAAGSRSGRYYQRFDRIERGMHALLMVTFIGCALTGLPLLLADEKWSAALVRLFGGFEGAGLIHRICAAVMIVVFVAHVVRVFARAIRRNNLMGILWGPHSMVPQPQDIVDMYRHVKWFLGAGPRPQFDRWTYWEKFDYWAVFWGMFIIGGSGLLLWFPEFFAIFLPGWAFNIATLVHGEEALLAVGFIFTIHFFNGHLRPEKFPMDKVIFTGRIPEHELKDERPVEYARLASAGQLAARETSPPSPGAVAFGTYVGGAAVIAGIVTIVLIFYSFM
jgi:cytochrome b subunit of formate dehydrogenase